MELQEGCFPLGGGKDVRPRVSLGGRNLEVPTWCPLFICGVELLFALCSVFVLCLYWLRARYPKNSNKDLEHTLSSVVKGIGHRHLRFVGSLYNIFV